MSNILVFIKTLSGGNKMAQWVKVFVTKPDDLNLIPGITFKNVSATVCVYDTNTEEDPGGLSV